MGVKDPLFAFYFDRAVFTFGTALEADLERAGQSRGKTKLSDTQVASARRRVMEQWLGIKTKYADPMAMRG
jgi:hypothetical protein